ncbi:MAG: class I SAM-dependent methyltransferase [Parcubacteria group bacterium]|jgi:ubiquinone/menaquinone biosynthesis C-methylase UbiE
MDKNEKTRWETRGIIKGRVPMAYTEQEIPGKILYSDAESENVSRKSCDMLSWINQSMSPGKKLLDIGSGPGHLEYWNMKINKPPFDITIYDQSSYFLNIAQEKIPNLKAVKADLPHLPFPDNQFDGVICIDILEHIYPETALQTVYESFRILKPGGWIFISIPNRHTWTRVYFNVIRHVWLASRKEIRALLETAGFDEKTIHIKTRGFPGANTYHELTRKVAGKASDFYLPCGGSVILANAQKPTN